MKTTKKLALTFLIFAICQAALVAVLSCYPSQYLPSQTKIIDAISFAKSSHNFLLIFSLFVFICIMAPVCEEIIFRLSLSRLDYLPLSLLCFFAMISAGILLPLDLHKSLSIWYRLLWIALLTPTAFHFFAKKISLQPLQKIWQHRAALAVVSSLAFALLHLDWSEISGALPLILLLTPYLFLGIVISCVRLKIGFFYGIFYHFLNNFLAFCACYLFNV